MYLRFAHRNLILVVCLALVCAVTVALSSGSVTARISSAKKAGIFLPPLGTTITVNSTADVTNSSDGLCTLHEAITAANTNTASGLAAGECAAGSTSDADTITFSILGTITLATELPAISSDLVIDGPGANALTVRRSTADGTPRFRIFTLNSATTVQINNITISQGHTVEGIGRFSSGDSGGGIFNNGTLVLEGATITGNQTGRGDAVGGHGGGIVNFGTLMIRRSTIMANETGSTNGSGSGGPGGGIANFGIMTIINSTITGNRTGHGSGRGGGGRGGGIYNGSPKVLTLVNVTISNNTTGLTNSASAGAGGGVHNDGACSLKNTIVANNFVGAIGGGGNDLSGTFNSQDYNLIRDTSGWVMMGPTSHNITGVDPKLGFLTLLPDSPAIDAGDNCVLNNSCSPPVPSAITTDQRGAGFNRSADGNGDGIDAVDIGAFEIQSMLVTNTSDSGVGSLRQAITDANVDPGLDAINFQIGLKGTITLLTVLPDLTSWMEFKGPGASQINVQRSTAGGTPQFRIFNIKSGLINLIGLTISGGLNDEGGAGILNNVGSTLNITDCLITGNTDNNFRGGGIANYGTLTLANSTVSSNTGHGILTERGVISITNSTLRNNAGSGINHISSSPFNSYPFNITNSTISGNGGGRGAGIFMGGGVLTMTNSTVSGNTGLDGGGFSFSGGTRGDQTGGSESTLILTNCTITGNISTSGGLLSAGGIQTDAVVRLKNSIIAGNFKNNGGTPSDISIVLGSMQSANNNLIGDANSSGGITHGVNGNQVGDSGSGTIDIHTVLDTTLAANGGPTFTHALVAGSHAIDSGTDVTTLNAAASNSITIFNLSDERAFPPGGGFVIRIDNEQMIVTGKTGNFIFITRAANGTTAAAHNNGTPVNPAFDQRGAGFSRVINTAVDIGAVEVSAIQFSQPTYTVDEGANLLSINVTRTGNASGPATVKYATSDATDVNFVCNPNTAGQLTGGASRKCDYHIAAGRLRFAAGETSKTIVLSLVNDVYVEGAETLTISLSNPTGDVLGSPNFATVTIADNDTPGQANPIDGTAFYVRMLYVDLLSREPDPAGFAQWVHRIDFCGQPGEPPPPCDRVTVGGDGFLRSTEFFEREFFVIRLYRTGLGRILRYDDMADLAFASGFLTDAHLELNKQEVVSDIMSRPEFGNIYNSLSNSQYVDTLIQTAAVTLPVGVRDGWVTALDGSTKTRAQVFRELSERSEVSAKYLHEAQVVSCYYGFFTRNPDGAYLTYLDRLDRGEINLGDLANAFINAAEYRQRFGP